MNNSNIHEAFTILRKQVEKLNVPWLEYMVHRSGQARDPFKVLISCILSLRTKDETTDGASRRLFRIASTPLAISRLPLPKIRRAIYPVGFYKTKAQTIRDISRELVKKHGSRVPDTMDALLQFKGVGRKTANIVLTHGFGKPGIAVDTHVHRISNRLGLVETRTPEKTEPALKKVVPRRLWREINHLMVRYGQSICVPVKPKCGLCSLADICRYYIEIVKPSER